MENSTIEYNLTKWEMTPREFSYNIGFNLYHLHQIICRIFDESCQFEIANYNDKVHILIKSMNEIKEKFNVGTFTIKHCVINIKNNEEYLIECNLNATKTIKNGTKNGKKIPFIGYSQLMKWFNKKSESFGILPIELEIGPSNRIKGGKTNGQIIDWHHIELKVKVTNNKLFSNILINGIGDSRKFGCGLVKVFY